MHMPPPGAEGSILEAEPAVQAHLLLKRLAPEQWPVPLEAFPAGSALVGGAVRDGLLNRLSTTPDLDLVVPDQALRQTRDLAKRHGGACVVLDEGRDMARLVVKGWTIDLARREGASLEADLQRRDYRINAIALELTPTPRLVDPTGGLNDLHAGLLTAVTEQNLIDDPLRLLRGLRLAAELGFAIAGATQPLLALHSHRLPQAAPERIQAELNKLVRAPWAEQAITQLPTSGLIQPWAASTTANSKALTAQSIEQKATRLSEDEREQALPLLRLTALLSDEGLQQLRFSRRQIQRCKRLRAWQQRDDGQAYAELPDEERLQLHIDLGTDLPALLIQFSSEQQQTWLDRWRDPQDHLFHPRPPIDGNTLQKTLGIPPGPELGRLIKHLAVEDAFGRLEGQEAALATARSWWLKHSNSSLDA